MSNEQTKAETEVASKSQSRAWATNSKATWNADKREIGESMELSHEDLIRVHRVNGARYCFGRHGSHTRKQAADCALSCEGNCTETNTCNERRDKRLNVRTKRTPKLNCVDGARHCSGLHGSHAQDQAASYALRSLETSTNINRVDGARYCSGRHGGRTREQAADCAHSPQDELYRNAGVST